MARAKTREGAAISYARGVKEWSPQIGEHQLVRAFIDGARWQKNRSNKLAIKAHNARVRAGHSATSEHQK